MLIYLGEFSMIYLDSLKENRFGLILIIHSFLFIETLKKDAKSWNNLNYLSSTFRYWCLRKYLKYHFFDVYWAFKMRMVRKYLLNIIILILKLEFTVWWAWDKTVIKKKLCHYLWAQSNRLCHMVVFIVWAKLNGGKI